MRRLQRAVFFDAACVLMGVATCVVDKGQFQKDLRWVRGYNVVPSPFSLREICDSLGYDYWTMRERLLVLAAKRRRRKGLRLPVLRRSGRTRARIQAA